MQRVPVSWRCAIQVFFVSVAVLSGAAAYADRIEGTVVIKKKLTRRRVTAEVPMYQRGTAVALSADAEADPLAFERSRVAIWIEGPISKDSAAAPAAKLEQTNRRFSPEIIVIPAGAKVSFPNNDPVFHNVFSLSGPKSFDLGNYPKGDTRFVTFAEPGIVYVNCHLHPNMAATIVVTPNKWNTLAGRDGHFSIEDVPPGKYTVVAWHKAAGFFRQSITLTEGRNEPIEFLIPIDENGRMLESHRRE